PQRQVVEILPDDSLVRNHEHSAAEPVSRVLRRLHERESKREAGESLRRTSARIEADRRVPIHLTAIDAFDAEQAMLRQLPQEDRKEPAVDHDLRAAFLRTVEARPIVEEAEDPQADPFFDVDGVERLRGPGRRSGRSPPTGGT